MANRKILTVLEERAIDEDYNSLKNYHEEG